MSLFADNHREEFDLTDFMAFNKIYGQDTEESNQALIALINTVTEDKPEISDTLIKDIDAFDSIEYSNGQYCGFGFDICLESDTGSLFSLQMENEPDEYFTGRCLVYMDSMMESSDKLQKLIIVLFVAGENLFKDADSYHNVQIIRDEESGEVPFDKVRVHFIEIDKVDSSKDVSDMTPLERVSLYFRYANDPDKEALLEQLIDSGDKAIVLAENIFKRLTADNWACKKMQIINKYKADLSDAKEEGIEQGRAAEKKEMVKALKDKGVGVDIIAEVSGLSAKRIESM
ncbi:MAG: Rpn family recombination-promoting nuclease/putative transposase [Eubacteriales bacterium]|nr:Rpn family recombination-promoting nuclease/putative transposase [Eubacteriales bacterium]MDY2934415.1 Rpn family recombination-promoting nuclease/putative transposase [Anaerovoracaceae bacterium]